MLSFLYKKNAFVCIKINYYGEDNELGFDLGAFSFAPFLIEIT